MLNGIFQLNFIFSSPEADRPKFLVTCMYGIDFIILGNLAGNALAIGTYVMHAAGKDPDATQGTVIAIAIACVTASALLHISSRRGGIIMNNFFAVIKIAFLVAIIILGFLKASGRNLGGAPNNAISNFDPHTSFKSTHDFASYTNSLQYIIYAFSGFLQPFYVLAEVARPRKVFPKYTLIAMAVTIVLFLLVNLAYLCAVPRDLNGIAQAQDMATLFLIQVFGDGVAQKVMNGMIAFSIFGGMVVMTFTAARVKQEIAKEGILPYSLFFATGKTTPWALFKERYFSKVAPQVELSPFGDSSEENGDLNQVLESVRMLEKTPMAALGLHWFA